MKIDKKVPFYANTPDDTHCFQASLRMVMKYFWPNRDFSWEELEKITAKIEGLWTWPMVGVLWLQKRSFEVKIIEVFDYKKFIQFGGKYLIDEYGEEVGKAQIEHSDIEQERKITKKFIERVTIEKRIPTIDDLKEFLAEEYLVICNVNSCKLDNRSGYAGHFVVVKGFDDKYLFLHDPGLPPFENRFVNFDLFEEAWAYPNIKAKNIIAIRLKEKR